MEEQYRVIRIKTNAQNLYGWLALNSTDHPVGHVFMQVELDNKVKFMDAWVHEERKKGFDEGEACIYMEKIIENEG